MDPRRSPVGIPFQAAPKDASDRMLAICSAILHEDDFDPGGIKPTQAILLELVAAFCQGKIPLENSLLPHPKTASKPGREP